MSGLSDTQLIILSAAAQREDRNLLPLPGSLRGGAAHKVIGALLRRGLVEETPTDRFAKADPALNRFWRNDEDGRAILLRVTDLGLAAIGIEQRSSEDAPEAAEADPAPKTRKPRSGTKQARLIEMLRADGGATIDEIAKALDWKAHTVRGALAGALKRRLGLTITSEKVEGRGRVYRIDCD